MTRRWAASGLSARRRLDLFAGLLAQLTRARVDAGTTTTITSVAPATFADAAVRELQPKT